MTTHPDATRYHHGDLGNALVEAGLEAARRNGADAIKLREVTRAAGVTPRAAYRHFTDRDELVRAVAGRALSRLAAAIESRMPAPTPSGRELLGAVGSGYIAFALDEPGWFDVALFAMGDMLSASGPEASGAQGRSPYQLLEHALQVLVDEGLLDESAVGDAVVTCWSGVHGFATLTSRGPLRDLPRAVVDDQAGRLVAALVAAVTAVTA